MSKASVLGSLKVILGGDNTDLNKALLGAAGSVEKFSGTVKKVLAGLGLTAAVAAVGFAMKGALEEADNLGKAAQKIGIPVEELSKLKHAADLSDVSMETLTTSVARLSKNLAELAGGGENAASRALDAMGVSARNADGSLKPTAALISDIAERFKSYRDGAEKTALAIALFGKSGAELIPLLNLGKDGLAEMADEAKKLGLVIDNDAAKAAEDFNDNLKRLSRAKDGIVLQVTQRMSPALRSLSQTMLEAGSNTQLMQSLADGLTAVLRGAAVAGVTVVTVFQRMGAELSALHNFLSTSVLDWDALKKNWAAFVAEGAKTKAAFEGISASIDSWFNKVSLIPITLEGIRDAIYGKVVAPIAKAGEETENALDKFLTSTAKRQASMQAELQTIGLGVQAHQELKIKLEAEAIAKEQNITITDALRQRIDEASASYGRIAQNVEDAKSRFNDAKQYADRLGQSLENAFGSAVLEGENLRKVCAGLLKDLAKLMTNMAFKALLGGGKNEGNILTGLFDGSWFGGARAAGGPVTSGLAHLVGERGPELFVPSSPGTVISNRDLRGLGRSGGGAVFAPVYNIDASGADAAAIARLEATLARRDREFDARVISAFRTGRVRGAI